MITARRTTRHDSIEAANCDQFDQDVPYVVGGVYREVSPPEKLLYTWIWEKGLSDTSDWTTEIVLTQEQLADEHMRDEHNQGWIGCLDSPDRMLAAA